MNTYRVGCRLLFGALAGVGILIAGCSTTAANEDVTTKEADGNVGSLGFQLVKDPNFKGNSVFVCGDRKEDADGKYPCLSHFCRCLDFDEYTGMTGKVEDLCPSSDVGKGGDGGDVPPGGANWDFTYVVYNDKCDPKYPNKAPAAPAIALTDPTPGSEGEDKNLHNFVCYDKRHPQRFPNRSVNEELVKGKNHNEILCVTKNASKDWNFDVCVDESYDGYPQQVRLDCGCKLVNTDSTCPWKDACQCYENGLSIPDNWFADPSDSCHIKPQTSPPRP
jgi:hypothetical protein